MLFQGTPTQVTDIGSAKIHTNFELNVITAY